MFKVKAVIAAYIGVLVSFLEKNAGTRTFINIKNGSPKEKATKLLEACTTSEYRNSPLWKRVLIRCSEHIARPIRDGIAKNITSRWDFLNCSLYKTRSPLWFALERVGKRTVPMAIAKIPSGNWINLSETYNQVGLPVTRRDAKIVSIKRLIWATPPAIIAGNINIKTFFTPSLLIPILGIGNLSIWDKGASWISSWIIPASRTPHASPTIGIENKGAKKNAEKLYKD